jgi:hypothetical protein
LTSNEAFDSFVRNGFACLGRIWLDTNWENLWGRECIRFMIAMGFEIALISELTGLSQEEILPLMQEMEKQ